MYDPNQQYYSEPQITEQDLAVHVAKVMGWMCVGLLTTLASAMLCLAFPAVLNAIFSSRINFYIILIAQVGVVMALSRAQNRISATVATVLFMFYSALTGITFSTLALVFELMSIVSAFGVAASLFLVMCLYGFVTKRDLTKIGSLLFMGLIGIFIATIVNMFLGSAMVDFIICIVGVLLFLALTAYDVRKIKENYMFAAAHGEESGGEVVHKLAIFGALNLYLDFINIFLYLLRLFGKRR